MPRKPPVRMAMAYDFDGTLAPGNMQEYDFIPALKMRSRVFWKTVNELAAARQMDHILAYMYVMLEEAGKARIPVRVADFHRFGAGIALFPGVREWFGRQNARARERGLSLEHFVISSGLREMVEGTDIAGAFRKVYASAFMYDHNGVACWPALAVNYTTKTQFLFRVNKGCLDVHDDSIINRFVPKERRPVPFQHMVFLGDGETDIPCMRLVKDQGGLSLAVFNPARRGARAGAARLVAEGRATMAAPADYREGGALDRAVAAAMDKVAAGARIG